MADFAPSESHIRNCVLFHFHAGLSATETTTKICDIYEDVLKASVDYDYYDKMADSSDTEQN